MRQPLMTKIEPASNTKGREIINREVMPRFSKLCKSGDKIYFIGKHRFWDYSGYFNNPALQCDFQTVDCQAGEGPDIVDNLLDTKLPPGSADGMVYIGMNDDIEKTEVALQNIYKTLKPGGRLLMDFAGVGDTRPGQRRFVLNDSLPLLKDFVIDEVSIIYGDIWDGGMKERYADGQPIAIFVTARKPKSVV